MEIQESIDIPQENQDIPHENQDVQELCEPLETEDKTTPTPMGKGKRIISKILAEIRRGFSPENRKKTIIILSIIMLLIAAVYSTASYFSPNAVVKRYARAHFNDDIIAKSRVWAFDLYSWELKEDSEEEYFDYISEVYDEDLYSWEDLAQHRKLLQKEYWEENYGKYYISYIIARTRECSFRRLKSDYDSYLALLDKYGVNDGDQEDITDAKEITVNIKVSGEGVTGRATYKAILVKMNGFWKVLVFTETT